MPISPSGETHDDGQEDEADDRVERAAQEGHRHEEVEELPFAHLVLDEDVRERPQEGTFDSRRARR